MQLLLAKNNSVYCVLGNREQPGYEPQVRVYLLLTSILIFRCYAWASGNLAELAQHPANSGGTPKMKVNQMCSVGSGSPPRTYNALI